MADVGGIFSIPPTSYHTIEATFLLTSCGDRTKGPPRQSLFHHLKISFRSYVHWIASSAWERQLMASVPQVVSIRLKHSFGLVLDECSDNPQAGSGTRSSDVPVPCDACASLWIWFWQARR